MSEIIEVKVKRIDKKFLKPMIDDQVDIARNWLSAAIDQTWVIRKKLDWEKDKDESFAIDLIEANMISARAVLKSIKEIIVGE